MLFIAATLAIRLVTVAKVSASAHSPVMRSVFRGVVTRPARPKHTRAHFKGGFMTADRVSRVAGFVATSLSILVAGCISSSTDPDHPTFVSTLNVRGAKVAALQAQLQQLQHE